MNFHHATLHVGLTLEDLGAEGGGGEAAHSEHRRTFTARAGLAPGP